jgi:hypothetical protein
VSADPTPQELAEQQRMRQRRELEEAGEAPDEEAARAHERRAEAAAYLRHKLEQQAESDR